MRLENSTHWSDLFLRRMVSFCCKELEVPVRTIKHARFRNSRSSWGGVARSWKRQITACVGRPECFPTTCNTHKVGESFADQVECLVAVTAHEIYHVAATHVPKHQQKTRGRDSYASSERATCVAEFQVLNAFRADRANLLADWERPFAIEPVIKTVQEQRAEIAEQRLTYWLRKAKLAATKVRKYKAKVAYYAKKQAVAAAPKA